MGLGWGKHEVRGSEAHAPHSLCSCGGGSDPRPAPGSSRETQRSRVETILV